MAEESIYDAALKGIGDIIEEVSDSIAIEFKGKKPFDKEPVSNEEMLYHYNQLTPEQMDNLIQTKGRDAVNEMIYKMEQLKQRRR